MHLRPSHRRIGRGVILGWHVLLEWRRFAGNDCKPGTVPPAMVSENKHVAVLSFSFTLFHLSTAKNDSLPLLAPKKGRKLDGGSTPSG